MQDNMFTSPDAIRAKYKAKGRSRNLTMETASASASGSLSGEAGNSTKTAYAGASAELNGGNAQLTVPGAIAKQDAPTPRLQTADKTRFQPDPNIDVFELIDQKRLQK